MSESGPDAPQGATGENATGGARRPERPPVRALDPATAMRLTDGRPPLPALYLSDRLLVRNEGGRTRGLDDLGEALAKLDLDYTVTPRQDGGTRDLDQPGWGTSITIRPTRSPIEPVDAWSVLQRLRQENEPIAERLSLEHVLRPADGYWGGVGGYWGGVGGYWGGVGGYWGGVGGYWGGVSNAVQEYAVPGRGGRMPVALALPDPRLRARTLERSPVVVVPDTAIAGHPWFKDDSGIVRLELKEGRLVPLLTGPPVDPPVSVPAPAEPAGLLQGHATFIAGLLRQGCPEATIVSIPVMGDDGVVDESYLLDVLQALLDRHVHGQQHDASEVVDVLNLSMGYYAEDRTYTSGPVADLLDRFAEHGVLVVAGVGNDGTDAPFVPAALAAEPPARITAKSMPPLASVGASNPDGVTVALFSNNLPVVSAVRAGVSVVSTLPLTNGMGQPSSQVSADGTVRCTVDPDDYTGGFGVWSGTSFSTPVFAAELAAALIDEGGLTDVSSPAMRKRAIRALRSCIGRARS